MNPTRKPLPARRLARGATLVEVLVSIVGLSIGLLGAAALQSTALRQNQASYERSQLTVLGQAMLDAMRNNPAGVDSGQDALASWTCSAPAGGGLANADLGRWIGDLQAQINPSACGRIACQARVCTVGIRWDDSRVSGGSNAAVYEIESRL